MFLLGFIWHPAVVIVAALWATYVNVRAGLHAKRLKSSDEDIAYLRFSVAGASFFFAFAHSLRWIASLSPAQYLGIVSPLTPVIFLVVYGLPAWLYLRRSRMVQETLQAELKRIEETVGDKTE